MPSFRDRILARSSAIEAQQARQQEPVAKQQEVGKQQGQSPFPTQSQKQGISHVASTAGSMSRMQKYLDHKKSIPDTTNRAALALNRNTQARMQESNRMNSPSAEYLRVQRLQKMRAKLQTRQKTGRER